MIRPATPDDAISVLVHPRAAIPGRLPALAEFTLAGDAPAALSRHPGWLRVLQSAFGHEVYALEAQANGQTCGFLPLAYVSSFLFGRFLVSLPYLNSNGVAAASPDVQTRLIDRAVELAGELNVRYLELRHENPVEHPALNGKNISKVHMRLDLPDFPGPLWNGFDPKVRNQVRKGEKSGLTVAWGAHDLLSEFYQVMSHNMRDLGTPIYSHRLFAAILDEFPGQAELCVVRKDEMPAATALLLHGNGVTEVPSASALREYNSTCANMFMYWQLLDRAVQRRQRVFDFGRSTVDGPTFKFKKQWGAKSYPATWQYAVRQGTVGDMRPDNPRYQRMIRLWQRLPVRVTQYIGPPIVRGIP
jgi:FemAB-related protein (PEP-CTERM system-associated)